MSTESESLADCSSLVLLSFVLAAALSVSAVTVKPVPDLIQVRLPLKSMSWGISGAVSSTPASAENILSTAYDCQLFLMHVIKSIDGKCNNV